MINWDEFSKEDMAAWIRRYCFYREIKRSDLLTIKWERLTKEMESKRKMHSDEFHAIDLKKRDEYAVAFNAATNREERLRLAELMVPIHVQLTAYLEKLKALRREEKKRDRVYESIEAARRLEGTE